MTVRWRDELGRRRVVLPEPRVPAPAPLLWGVIILCLMVPVTEASQPPGAGGPRPAFSTYGEFLD